MNRKLLASGIALAAATTAFATSARVESMGKNSTYFQDDANIWLNPADANLYPNYLLGELGQKTQHVDTTNTKGWSRYNIDPVNPWFGAIFAKSLAKNEEQNGNRYPQVLIGGAFNRQDEWLDYMPLGVQIVTWDKVASAKTLTTYDVSNYPVKWDGVLGFAAENGSLYGLKTYFAYTDSVVGAREVKSVVNTYTLGGNFPFGSRLSVEANATIGFLSLDINDTLLAKSTGGSATYSSGMSPSIGADARAFIDASPVVPIVFVPAVSLRSINAPSRTITKFRVGSGANVSLDRGFFWLGLDYFTSSDETFRAGLASDRYVSDSAKSIVVDDNGIRVSFGIERNIWTDWFVIRVGGQKVINFQEVSGGTINTSVVSTNPEGNDPATDLVSFGFGLNIEDKLKVDAVVAKDFLFTGGNFLSGASDHVLSRISASYSF